jgi:hypothetical protein
VTGPQIIQAGGFEYRVVFDDPAIPFEPFQALVRSLALDETTGLPLRAQFTALPDHPFARGKTAPDGLFCLMGSPSQVLPDHANTAAILTLTLRASGYRDQTVSVNVPAGAPLPIVAPVVQMQRVPVRLMGRITTDDTARSPIAGASVISVIDPDSPPPLERTELLRAPLRFNHAAGTNAQQRVLNDVVLAPPRSLYADVRAGSTIIVVNNRQGLAAGQILQVGSERYGEYVSVSAVSTTPANLSLPGEVTLSTGLAHSFKALTAIRVYSLGALTGVARSLAHDAFAGDGLLIPNGDLPSGIVEIIDGPHTELVVVGALTNMDGVYRFDGVGHVAQLFLQFSALGYNTPAKPTPWVINYESAVNVVDCRLSN